MNARSRFSRPDNAGPGHGALSIPSTTKNPAAPPTVMPILPDRTVLGVLDVILSLKEVDREKEINTRNIVIFALLFLLGAFG